MSAASAKTIIIGAGITGLSAAYFLKKPYALLEADKQAGGLCRSFYNNGFTFDVSGHFIHIKDEKIKNLVNALTGGLDEIERKAAIFLHGRFIPYPFQANLYYLDEKTKKECINGILKRENSDISTSMPFAQWCRAMFGRGITKYFMEPYNKKLWSYDLNKMTALWSGAFVPKPDSQEILKSAYEKNRNKYGYNSVFYYPKTKGCQALIDGLLKKVEVQTDCKIVEIDLKNKTVTTRDGQKLSFKRIISTQPLTQLIKQIKNVPQDVKQAAQKLICNSVRCINIGVKSKYGVPKILKNTHWLYMPESKFPFYRVGLYSNVNKSLAPEGCYSFYVECSAMSPSPFELSAQKAERYLRKAGFIRDCDEIAALNAADIAHAYVIFDNNMQRCLGVINGFLNKNNIFSIGRYGAWEYSFIEKNIKDAKSLAKKINDGEIK
ncbi:MAG: FAD-dependent oxidoreductase [Endomicrobium sp.]|jgi:protoporphyrinogen oxidase|nr:FAD-dependent oxidoreductase [Endomicrobium sp.]